MKPKSSKNLVSSLRGSAFRKVTVDGRAFYARHIRTLGRLKRTKQSKLLQDQSRKRLIRTILAG